LRLSRLLAPLSLRPEREEEITLITEDSREVERGALFFAFKGTRSDGNLFIEEALKRGAVAVITDSEESVRRFKGKAQVFRVNEPRKALAILSARFYKNPEKRLKLVGITGTNGKTTTALLLYEALKRLGVKSGYVGTLGWSYSENFLPLGMTTPSPTKLFKILKEMEERGVEVVVLEVSSHALELDRVYGIEFEASAFTNLTPEHLDFHGELSSYFLAKEKLFFSSKRAAVNCDCPWGRVLYPIARSAAREALSFGRESWSTLRIREIGAGEFVLEERGGKTFPFKLSLFGEHNAYNATAAASLLKLLGFWPLPRELFLGIRVSGRMEEVAEGVFVDYAHTPDALKRLLESLKREAERRGGRLITVFGCGGERDSSKRAPMGRIAQELSDLVIITNDNPRGENPLKIAREIISGMEETKNVKLILERSEAIREALSLKSPSDVVAIAGKGHEEYQIIGNKKIPFSDRGVVEEFYGRRERSENNRRKTKGEK